MRLSNLSFTDFSGWVALAVKNQESGFTMISSKSYLNLQASLISGTYYITAPMFAFIFAFPVGSTHVHPGFFLSSHMWDRL